MLLARKLGAGWSGAFLAALLMAVHPQHVQLVAWIAERKDLLSYLFALLALFGYLQWVEHGQRWVFALTLGCFFLGLTSRFLIAGLPLLLLALDAFPLRRKLSLHARLKEKLPFFLLGGFFVAITYFMQAQQTARFGIDVVPLWHRSLAICGNGVLYLWNTVCCRGLSFYNGYPFGLSPLLGGGALLLLGGVSFAAWRLRACAPFLALGWVWYLAALLPVAGFAIFGANFHSDHYSYLPHMGVFLIFAFIFDRLPTLRWQGVVGAAVVAAAVALALISTRQVDSYTGMDAIIEREKQVAWDRPRNVFIVAGLHRDNGEFAEAERCWQRVVELGTSPELSASHHELSRFHFERGDLKATLNSLKLALNTTDQPNVDLVEAHRQVAEVVAQGIYHR